MYISLVFSIDFSSVCESFTGEFFVVLLAVLIAIKSLVASAVFWIIGFEAVLNAAVADFL